MERATRRTLVPSCTPGTWPRLGHTATAKVRSNAPRCRIRVGHEKAAQGRYGQSPTIVNAVGPWRATNVPDSCVSLHVLCIVEVIEGVFVCGA